METSHYDDTLALLPRCTLTAPAVLGWVPPLHGATCALLLRLQQATVVVVVVAAWGVPAGAPCACRRHLAREGLA